MAVQHGILTAALLTLLAPSLVSSQDLAWHNDFRFYGDNTEFFSFFREGETLLGGQFRSYARFETTKHTEVFLGVFGDQRNGSDKFLETVKPIVSFRYRTPNSLGVLGTLETVDRHGLLEPLQVTTFEITRPIEYGLQWIERRENLDAEAFINWQVLETDANREIFDYGIVLRVRPLDHLSVEFQGHGTHRGGQLSDAGGSVATNFAGGPGIRLTAALPEVREGSLAIFRLWSSGTLDDDAPNQRPDSGSGTYLRASITPRLGEFFTILWWGRNFLSHEGDNNYNSVGLDPTFYRSRRRYTEIGFVRRMTIDDTVDFRVEFRLHRIDNDASQAISGTDWEYSYRFVVDVPFNTPILSGN